MADELSDVLQEAAAANRVPGVAAGVLANGETQTACVGVTNVDHPLPVTSSTLFQVASITKTFVATAVMLLVEDGRVALDDAVATHMPDLAARTGLDTNAITVEHLLSHQAGFDGDHLFVGRVPESLDQLHDARRLFEPGTGVSYCNAGFSIAGALITAVTDESCERFIAKHLLKPLGINAAFTANEVITQRVAAPHVVGKAAHVFRGAGVGGGWELGPIDRPAGGLITSVDGLLRWAQFHMGEGDGIITRASLDRMQQPTVALDRWTSFALDWAITEADGVTVIDHGGLNSGYCSILVLVPSLQTAVVALTHATNGGLVNNAIRRWALEHYAGVVERDAAPDPSVAINAAKFEGRFIAPFAQLTIAAGAIPNTLIVSSAQRDDVDGWKPPAEPPVTLAFVDDHHAVSTDAATQRRVRFGFDSQGTATWLTWGSRRAIRVLA